MIILEINMMKLRSKTTNFSRLKLRNKRKAFKIDAKENAKASPICGKETFISIKAKTKIKERNALVAIVIKPNLRGVLVSSLE